jgi:uncharacterized protein (TIGR00661 family)
VRILYGVVGEGMGHAMRSRVILDHLSARHDLQVVVSGRAYDYLARRAGEHLRVQKIWGYSLVYENNVVRNFKTALENVRGAIKGWPKNVRAYFELAERFQPDVVISDFESWSTLFARRHRLPLLSVDNIQMLDRCAHAPEITRGLGAELRLAKGIVRTKVPRARHYYITTFFYPPVRKPRTSLHPPVLRPEILAARPEPGGHLLVYQTTTSNRELPRLLARSGRECRVYGLRRDLTADVVDGNVRYRPFSEAGFIDDLRTAAGVVASAGFTLMGEAVYLGRPMLALPVARQVEQVLNTRYLEAAGYGLAADKLTAAGLGTFLERLPDFARNLRAYRQDGNRDLFAALDRGLRDVGSSPD